MQMIAPYPALYNGKTARPGEALEILPQDVDDLKAVGWQPVHEETKHETFSEVVDYDSNSDSI